MEHGKLTPETKVSDLQGWKLISPEQQKRNREYMKREQGKGAGFVMMKRDNFNEVKSHLTLSQHGVLMYLITCMKINEEGKLFKSKTERLSMNDACKLLGKKPAMVRRVIGELEALSIVYREKEGKNVYLSISDDHFICGDGSKGYKTVKIFKQELKRVAKELSLTELGFFALMLGHMHWDTHVLCDNPDEKDNTKIVLWKKKHLADELGVSRPFLSATMKKLRELRIIAEVRTVNEGVVLHPNFVCRQVNKPSWETICDTIDNCISRDNLKK
jgi:DNA-binding transcriptional ArsR family regulator